MEENLLCEIDEGLAEMRLLIEGAAALYALRKCIRAVQDAHMKAIAENLRRV